MTRLHELTPEQLEAWRKARMERGREKYGDAHLKRNGPVDVAEELLDAHNILELLWDRIRREGYSPGHDIAIAIVRVHLNKAMDELIAMDKHLPDALCTDEQGGRRIWWGEGDGK